MSKRNNSIIIIILVLSLSISLACGSSNEGTKITTEPSETSGNTETSETQETESSARSIFEVGDLIDVEEHTIRLNSIEYKGTTLVANFSVENNGDSDISISSMLAFSAKKEDGTKLDQEIFDCDESSLGGSVLPGDKLRGGICWAEASPDDGIKIYYEASLFGEGAIVWNAAEGTAEPLNTSTDSESTIEAFKVGDLIELDDHTIRLNSIEYKGTVLVANFLVENSGNSDTSISSMLSFSAKREDGTKLDQEIFDCEASGLDGSVIVGDRLRGSICWSEANPDDGIKIYYEASMFGEGAVVWETVAAVSEPEINSDAELKVDVFKTGDVIQVNNHSIVLNEITFEGDVLMANFTIENQGDSDISVSSMLSFYARTRDGSELEQDIFACGSSLNGDVLPSDKLKGDICWSGANVADGIKIYYEADLFGQGAVVWVVE